MQICPQGKRNREIFSVAPLRPAGREEARLKDFAPAILLLLVGLPLLVAANLWVSSPSAQYVVVAAPGSTLGQTFSLVQSAQGGVVEVGRFSNIVVAASTRSDFREALHKAGAWLVLTPGSLRGCFEETDKGAEG